MLLIGRYDRAHHRLELEGYDPRGLLIPTHITLRRLTVRDVQDGDDWIEELLVDSSTTDSPLPRFPNLRYLALLSTSLLNFPPLPLTELRHLDLSHNLLNSIPSSLASLHNLRTLNLSNNLITSVRNAPSALGNIVSLNLSKNRIDCLVGLERVLGLERVDVRSNELPEYSEVGRLAVLPHIKEVWCANNLFDLRSEEWRTGLGASFAQEGKEVVVDDRPWTWAEKRTIDAALASKGYTVSPSQPHSRQSSAPGRSVTPSDAHRDRAGAGPSTQSRQPSASASASYNHPSVRSQVSATSTIPSQVASPSSSAIQKKRRPRRVINLDEEGATSSDDNRGVIGGSLRLPDKVIQEEEAGASLAIPKKGSTRSRVTARTFEPPQT